MRYIILHNDGVYNLYSNLIDDCMFDYGITKHDLLLHIKETYGIVGLADNKQAIYRAEKFGTSSRLDNNLRETLASNRARQDDTYIPYDEMIKKYFTLEEIVVYDCSTLIIEYEMENTTNKRLVEMAQRYMKGMENNQIKAILCIMCDRIEA